MERERLKKYVDGGRVNLHSHTQFCDGRSTMEEILAAARREGFRVWGFTPHAPISIPSPCNMKPEDVPRYMAEVERLRSVYPEITILAGMEVDYLNEDEGPATDKVRSYGVSYVIGSVHFIADQQGVYRDIDGSPESFARNVEKYFGGDLDYVVRTFWEQTRNMIAQGGFDIIGHIDKIGRGASAVRAGIEEEPEYLRMARDTIEMAIDSGIAVEINTKHYSREGRYYPNPRFWKRLVDAGITIPVNTDTHRAAEVSAGLNDARKLLDEQY